MVQVKITVTVVTAQYGALSAGDILRTNQAFADHLVNECKAAQYMTVDVPKTDETPKRKRGK